MHGLSGVSSHDTVRTQSALSPRNKSPCVSEVRLMGSDFLSLYLSCATSVPASLLVASILPYPKMGFILYSAFQASVLDSLSFFTKFLSEVFVFLWIKEQGSSCTCGSRFLSFLRFTLRRRTVSLGPRHMTKTHFWGKDNVSHVIGLGKGCRSAHGINKSYVFLLSGCGEPV